MSLDYQVRPVGEWPQKPTIHRRETVFRGKNGKPMPLSDTLEILERELAHLGARNVILQVAVGERDIRQDGRIRADARRPAHPGVILTFDSRFGPLSYPCDTFTDWESNLRAIAFHLENTRHATLYGVGKYGEGYRGFTALPPAPPGGGVSIPPNHVRRAAVTLLHLVYGSAPTDYIERMIREPEYSMETTRKALGKAHPDGGGTGEKFILAQDARTVLTDWHREGK